MKALRTPSAVLFLGLFLWLGDADINGDKQALMDFISLLPHSRALNWNLDSAVCGNWTGVTCSRDKSQVIAVRLPGVGFQGPLPPNTLSRVSGLQTLSLRANGISGPFPSDFSNLRNLSFLYLQFNDFSGPLPSDFTVWRNLTIVNLSNNAFNGSIPKSISSLTQLTAVNFANNLLSGEIPDMNSLKLQQLDLSNNNLSGEVPNSLKRFPSSSFQGNHISFVNISTDVPATSSHSHTKLRRPLKLGETALMGIIVAGCVVGLLGLGSLLIICYLKRKGEDVYQVSGKLQKGDVSPDKGISGSRDANNRLVFFEGCTYAFDLEDLLRASAEVLGKGTFGMAYKAILEDATLVVVRRLKEVNVGKKDFEQQMELLGSIRHENVVALRAYYYSKDEKLMVYDHNGQGSVAGLLHDRRDEGRTPLDWDTRLRIAIGAARGIAHVHTQNSGKLVHGNIRTSNIFLNSNGYGCVSDVGLAAIMYPLGPPISRAAGYRAPEVSDTRKAQQPSDVYSFGVVLLELLTGKSPVHTTRGDELVHLVRWVHSVVREEWTAEVFDIELLRYPNIEEEMVEMLQVALACVVRAADQRPKMSDVAKMVESIRQIDTGNRPSSDTRSGASTPAPYLY
uniref:Protein kinase domain-containing protein n=1 Tax=Kalanchoe fedtschenkoi TaxID=63787 RepID=A0A7N0TS17_KALFE